MINKHNTKHLKKDKQRINTCSLASYSMLGLVVVRNEKKEIDLIFTDKVGKC